LRYIAGIVSKNSYIPVIKSYFFFLVHELLSIKIPINILTNSSFILEFDIILYLLLTQVAGYKIQIYYFRRSRTPLFSSLQALSVGVARRRHRIQEIFNQLTFEQVMSVSSYHFMLEALFYAASY
jgi:hypothetical protein